MATIYALLIGINSYPVKPLNGCINDVNAVEACLTKLYGARAGITLRVNRITDADPILPTRDNIIEGFNFFDPAGEEDSCLLYYSGHGSYSPAPPEFWTENDLRSESFVCIDSRTNNGKDLMDKEMGFLIWKTMQQKPATRFVVMTDCCHCGTITRGVDDSGITDRMMPDASGLTQLNDYLGYGELINGETYYQSTSMANGEIRINFLQGRHIHLAASRDNQTAKELTIDGQKRGAFTHSILKTLYETEGNISYRQLVNRAALLVRNLVSDQSPGIHLNALRDGDGDGYFLTGVSETTTGYLVYHDPLYKWCVKGGPVHGISTGDIVLIDDVGETLVTGSPAADLSTIKAIPEMVQGAGIYHAQVVRQAAKQISVAFSPGVPQAVQSRLISGLSAGVNDAFTLVTQNDARLIIHYQDGLISLTKAGSMASLIKPLPLDSDSDTSFLLQRLELVCSWLRVHELHQESFSTKPYQLFLYRNKVSGNYDPADFELVPDIGAVNQFAYGVLPDGSEAQPAFRLAIRNTGTVPLWVASAWLGFDYSIATGYFEEIQLLAPGAVAWLTFVQEDSREDTVLLNLDEKYFQLGYSQITEYLKLFISFEAMDIDGLKQEGLDLPLFRSKSATSRSPGSVTGSNGRVQRQWATETIAFAITRQPGKQLLLPGTSLSLNKVVIEAHPRLMANIGLVSSAVNTKSAGEAEAPPHAAWQNSYLEPLDFMGGERSSDPTDVLELSNVQDPDVVTPEQPLVLRIKGMDTNDVIAIGYDAENKIYYPVGYGSTGNEIIINTLPSPIVPTGAIDEKSLLGSLRIYFQKVIGSKLGFSYEYPRLAIVTETSDGNLNYEAGTENVSDAVSNADDIIIFVHGIIGDTESIVKSVFSMKKKDSRSIVQGADLLLCFDYENLHTTIGENAAMLKARLIAAGLAEGHGKHVTIIAHSMGGLVSRWFIEKLAGNQLINQLVMLGTPNNGTPWADVRDMAETMLTYALNGAAFLKPWMFILNLAAKVAGGTQVTLKEMDKDTGIYKLLNDGTDPGIRYVIIAGNTKDIIPAYDRTATVLSRLFARIRKRGIYDALDVALFREANDIAVTTKSISGCGANSWSVAPIVKMVASDHLNYFNSREVLDVLINAGSLESR